jgi:ribose-phosphate pyrophosphokinase
MLPTGSYFLGGVLIREVSLVIGPSSPEIGSGLAQRLGIAPLRVEHKIFPDGESYFRFTERPLETVILVQGTHPPQDHHIQQLLLMAAGLEDAGARRIIAVVPYLAYARQDKAFLEGEVVSLSVLLKLMKTVGVGDLVTVNPHAPWALSAGPLRAYSLSAARLLARVLVERGWMGRYIVSPGKKGAELASEMAEVVGGEPIKAETRRDPYTGEVEVTLDAERSFSGADVVVIDDVVSTGTTMSRLIAHLRGRGARRIYACCIHGLFVGGADEKISRAGSSHIITTNTVPGRYSEVDVSPILAECIAEITR